MLNLAPSTLKSKPKACTVWALHGAVAKIVSTKLSGDYLELVDPTGADAAKITRWNSTERWRRNALTVAPDPKKTSQGTWLKQPG